MRLRIILLMLVMWGSVINLNSQWIKRNSNLPSWSSSNAIDVCCDTLTAIIAIRIPPSNPLYITTDAGLSWDSLELPHQYGVVDVSIIDRDHIWFAYGSIIYATSNGGTDWELQFEDISLTDFMNYIEMFDLNNGVAMGDAPSDDKPALFLRTTDGGNNWVSMNDTNLIGAYSGDMWRRVDFINIDVGYFHARNVENEGIYKTTNGGVTWEYIDYPFGGDVNILKFYDENLGIVAYGANIYRTLDGGESWQAKNDTVVGGWGNDIEFLPNDPSKIWLTTGGLFFSSDTGKTWTEQENIDTTDNWGKDIAFYDNKHGWWLCGNPNGKIFYTSTGNQIVTNIKENLNYLTDFHLYHNYPNPFNPSTKIKYTVPQSSNVVIKVFDILGNEIETLVNEEKQIGTYEITWNAGSLPSGIYIYRLQAASFVETKKMILMK